MKINVKLHSRLERYSKTNSKIEKVVINEPIKVQCLMEYYKFSPGEVGVIIVNGKLEKADTMLYDNDSVEFHPIFGGG